MEIPIVGGAYEGRSKNLNAQLCQNLFPMVDPTGKKPAALFYTAGLTKWTTISGGGAIRAMRVVDTNLYVVSGNSVYKITEGGVITTLTGTISGTSGRVYLAHDDSYVVIVDPTTGNGYYVDRTGTTVASITDADFPDAVSLTYQDAFFVVTARNTGYIYACESSLGTGADPTSWDALDFASAEGHPDFALVVKSHLRELFIFGVESTEVFYNSGDSDFPFERIPGSFSDTGIGAVNSLAVTGNKLFFLGHDYSVYRTEGIGFVRISTQQIDYQIAQLSVKSDAVGYGYTLEGVSFYVLNFPTDDKTFVYDLSTQVWHTRASGTENARHPIDNAVIFAGKVLAGHHSKKEIYYYDYSNYTDNGDTLIRKRRFRAVDAEHKTVFHYILEIEFESGVGLATGQGSDPQVMLRWSDDGGHTWSNEHWTTIGAIGEYKNRARWKKLGKSRERIYEVSVSDPVKVVIIAGYLEASVGAH